MDETIGVKGGHNDRRRSIVIAKNKKKKLEEYEEERYIRDGSSDKDTYFIRAYGLKM